MIAINGSKHHSSFQSGMAVQIAIAHCPGIVERKNHPAATLFECWPTFFQDRFAQGRALLPQVIRDQSLGRWHTAGQNAIQLVQGLSVKGQG
jgi:hypothetical protein